MFSIQYKGSFDGSEEYKIEVGSLWSTTRGNERNIKGRRIAQVMGKILFLKSTSLKRQAIRLSMSKRS